MSSFLDSGGLSEARALGVDGRRSSGLGGIVEVFLQTSRWMRVKTGLQLGKRGSSDFTILLPFFRPTFNKLASGMYSFISTFMAKWKPSNSVSSYDSESTMAKRLLVGSYRRETRWGLSLWITAVLERRGQQAELHAET